MSTVYKGTINLFSVKNSWFPILAIICMVLVALIFAFGVFLSPPLSLNTDNMEKVKGTIPEVLPNVLNTQSGYRMVFIDALASSF